MQAIAEDELVDRKIGQPKATHMPSAKMAWARTEAGLERFSRGRVALLRMLAGSATPYLIILPTNIARGSESANQADMRAGKLYWLG